MIDINNLTPEQRAIHLLKNNSTFSDSDVDSVLPPTATREDREQLLSSVQAVRLEGGSYTTQRMLHAEASIFKSAIGRKEETTHRINPELVDRVIGNYQDQGKAPKEEQTSAIRHITQETGGVAVVEGAAGVGKSFALGIANEAYRNAGLNTVGIAPSGSAAQELQDGTGIPSMTAHRLLMNLEQGGQMDANTVVFFDEAGFADSMTIARVTNACHETGAKLVLVGDSKQLESIATSNVLRELGDTIGRAEMTQIARQKDPEKAMVSQLFYEGKGAQAIAQAEAMGMVNTESSDDAANQAAADRYVDAMSDGSSVVALANTNRDVEDINSRITSQLVNSGRLDPATKQLFEMKDNDGNQTHKYFMEGQPVMFRENNEEMGVANGTMGTIKSMDRSSMTVEVPDGEGGTKDVDVNVSEYQRVDVAYAMTAHKSQGMTFDKAVYKADKNTDARLMYVASTRAREGTEIIMNEADKSAIVERASEFQSKPTSYSKMSEYQKKMMNQTATASQAATDASGDTIPASDSVADKNVLGGALSDIKAMADYRNAISRAGMVAGSTVAMNQASSRKAASEGLSPSESGNSMGRAEADLESKSLHETLVSREKALSKAGYSTPSQGMSRSQYLESLRAEFGTSKAFERLAKPSLAWAKGDNDLYRRYQDYYDWRGAAAHQYVSNFTNAEDKQNREMWAQQFRNSLDERLAADKEVRYLDKSIDRRAHEMGLSPEELARATERAEKDFMQSGSIDRENAILSAKEQNELGVTKDQADLHKLRSQREDLVANGMENSEQYKELMDQIEATREKNFLEEYEHANQESLEEQVQQEQSEQIEEDKWVGEEYELEEAILAPEEQEPELTTQEIVDREMEEFMEKEIDEVLQADIEESRGLDEIVELIEEGPKQEEEIEEEVSLEHPTEELEEEVELEADEEQVQELEEEPQMESEEVVEEMEVTEEQDQEIDQLIDELESSDDQEQTVYEQEAEESMQMEEPEPVMESEPELDMDPEPEIQVEEVEMEAEPELDFEPEMEPEIIEEPMPEEPPVDVESEGADQVIEEPSSHIQEEFEMLQGSEDAQSLLSEGMSFEHEAEIDDLLGDLDGSNDLENDLDMGMDSGIEMDTDDEMSR